MEQKSKSVEHYNNIDGLRAYSALGILMMHVLVNGGYALDGFVFERVIPSFTDLVFLFMIISSFSMCCGYYEKMLSGKIDLVLFYQKRFTKTWPFFAMLTVLDVVISPSVDALYEGFANLTLCFGLLPNARISVIGVGWTLGVIFVFYLLFPFFCFLMSDSRRRWLSMATAIVMNFTCRYYFFDEMHVVNDFSSRSSIMYCAVYFVAGGMVWHYKDLLHRVLGKWFCTVSLAAAILCGLLYFIVAKTTAVMVVMYSAVLLYAIGRKENRGLLNNKIVTYISGLSMEIYLCHMVVFRFIEKMGILRMISNELLSYIVAVTMTSLGSIFFTLVVRCFVSQINSMVGSRKS